MRKLSLIILQVLILLKTFAFASSETGETKNSGKMENLMNKKILVTYFSWSGHTKALAEKIHARVGGDIFPIETTIPYPTDYNETAYGIAKTQHEEGIHPEIKNTKNISDYDIVFLGTPAWWHTMAPPIMTFLEKNNFTNKVIVPFITHGGGGRYTITKEIGELAKGATVVSPFVIYENGDSKTDKQLENWLNNIQY